MNSWHYLEMKPYYARIYCFHALSRGGFDKLIFHLLKGFHCSSPVHTPQRCQSLSLTVAQPQLYGIQMKSLFVCGHRTTDVEMYFSGTAQEQVFRAASLIASVLSVPVSSDKICMRECVFVIGGGSSCGTLKGVLLTSHTRPCALLDRSTFSNRCLLFKFDFEIKQNGRDNFETNLSFLLCYGRKIKNSGTQQSGAKDEWSWYRFCLSLKLFFPLSHLSSQLVLMNSFI